MTKSRTTQSPLIGLIPTERIKKLKKQINKFWEMFDIRIDKDNAVNGSGKNILKLAALEQIVRFEEEIENIEKDRVDERGPFLYYDPFGGIPSNKIPAKPPHHLYKPTFWSWWQCKRCGFKTQNVSDMRKNNGCNMFANSDTDKKDWRLQFEDLKFERRYLSIKEEPIRGCYIESKLEWLLYPETGQAIQEDKSINEQVIEEMKKYARIRR